MTTEPVTVPTFPLAPKISLTTLSLVFILTGGRKDKECDDMGDMASERRSRRTGNGEVRLALVLFSPIFSLWNLLQYKSSDIMMLLHARTASLWPFFSRNTLPARVEGGWGGLSSSFSHRFFEGFFFTTATSHGGRDNSYRNSCISYVYLYAVDPASSLRCGKQRRFW